MNEAYEKGAMTQMLLESMGREVQLRASLMGAQAEVAALKAENEKLKEPVPKTEPDNEATNVSPEHEQSGRLASIVPGRRRNSE